MLLVLHYGVYYHYVYCHYVVSGVIRVGRLPKTSRATSCKCGHQVHHDLLIGL